MRRSWPTALVDGATVRLSRDTGPAVAGVLRAEVVLPRWVLDLPPAQRTLVIAHERAHVDARDPALLFAATALVWLAPWNPALWLVLARLRAAVEMDCDARVLRAHPEPRAYATLLLDVSERALATHRTRRFAPSAPTALAHSAPLLTRRIAAMTAAAAPRGRAARRRAALLVTLTAALSAAGALVPPPVVVAAPARPPQRARLSAASRRDTLPLYRESDVDTPVAPAAMRPPHYPDTLRAARVEGSVLLTFAVDTLGRVEPATVRVLQSSNALFTHAALATLDDARFKPALKQGRPVRQVVQLPFQFELR